MNRTAIEMDANQDRMWLELGSRGRCGFATRLNINNLRNSMLAQSKIEGVILKFVVTKIDRVTGLTIGRVYLRRVK